MVQFVFVHGVATRNTPEYQAAVANRDNLFRELLFTGNDVEIHSPMWGQHVPPVDQRVFGTDEGASTYSLHAANPPGLGGGLRGASASAGGGELSIGAIGKQDPVVALDMICSEMVDRAGREKRLLMPQELEAVRKSAELIAAGQAETVFLGNASPTTIKDILSAGGPASFGIGSTISEAVTAATDRLRNAVSTVGFGAVRDGLGSSLGFFLGDVLAYLKDGEHREKIRTEVGGALAKAHRSAIEGGGPLVAVGHSMGGVILADMLINPVASNLPEGLHVDALLTVGSQPGFFAALDLLGEKPVAGSGRKKPESVRHWINVFDPIDPLAFRADMIFAGVTDLSFNSVTGITAAHTTYFQRPQFYARSRERLRALGVL